MSDAIPGQRIEHETKVYQGQTVNVYDTYGRWKTGTKNRRVYPLGDNNWTTNIQLAMLQQRMERERR